MKLLTKDSDYAIRALLHLAQKKGGHTSSREISEKNKIPLRYLRRILQVMAQNKFIVTKEGVAGGFQLARKPKDVSIIDIIRLFQGDVKVSECVFRRKICHNVTTCVLRKELLQIEQALVKKLTRVTIKSLVRNLGKAQKTNRKVKGGSNEYVLPTV